MFHRIECTSSKKGCDISDTVEISLSSSYGMNWHDILTSLLTSNGQAVVFPELKSRSALSTPFRLKGHL